MHVPLKAAILFLALCVPALADLAAGRQAFLKGDYATALGELLPLAKQGNADARGMLGAMYEDGLGVPQDYKDAMRWYRLAAKQGDAVSRFCLGIMYLSGKGVPQDYKEAAVWLRLAADQKNPDAQYGLGIM